MRILTPKDGDWIRGIREMNERCQNCWCQAPGAWHRVPGTKVRFLMILILCGILLNFAQAHEGEKHAEPEAASVPIPTEGLETASATSDTFELVIKHPLLEPNKNEKLTLYLNDFASNEPIPEATILIHLQEAKEPITATPTNVPGIYEATLSFPTQGDAVLTASIKTKEYEDSLMVSGIKVGLTPPGKSGRFWKFFLWSLAAVAMILIAGGGFYLSKIR
jgi:hypothetical protein